MMHEIRLAARALLRSPAFTLTIVSLLAVAIAVNTLVFSLVNGVLLKALPFPDADRLVVVWESNAAMSRPREGASAANVLDWRERRDIFAGMAASHEDSSTFVGPDDAEEVPAALVSLDFFEVLGVAPLVGRTFSAADAARDERLVVLSEGFFRRRFGADPGIIGRSISLDGQPWLVTGVMPASFVYLNARPEIWQSRDLVRSFARSPYGAPPRDARYFDVVARLQPGVTLAQAASTLDALSATLAERHPRENEGWAARVETLHADMASGLRPMLGVLLAAVVLVLTIAAANAATLVLVRALARDHEVSVRLALGASRSAVLRPVFLECALLGVAAGTLGLAAARAGLDILSATQPDLARLYDLSLDSAALLYTLCVIVLLAATWTATTMFQMSRRDLRTSLQSGGARGGGPSRSRHRLRRGLSVAEVALATVLAVAAGLLGQSLLGLRSADAGFQPDRLLVAAVNLNAARYGGGGARLYYQRLEEAIESQPGVLSAGAVTALPFSPAGSDFERPFWREGEVPPASGAALVPIRMATPGYFETLGLRLVAGRFFDQRDRQDTSPVIVINQALARQLGPAPAVSTRLVIDYQGRRTPREIVGIVSDIRRYRPRDGVKAEVFIPHAQNPYLPMNVVVRTAASPMTLAPALLAAANRIDPTQPVRRVASLEQLLDETLSDDRFTAVTVSLLAAFALVLAALAIYGMLAHGVQERQRELSLRMALGASPGQVRRLVIREAAQLGGAGVAIGLAIALAATGYLEALLFGVASMDAATFAGAGIALFAIALVAGWLPARRAAAADLPSMLR